MALPQDVVERIQLDFGRQADEALRMLRQAIAREYIDHPRVVRSIVYLSKGQITTLSEMIEAAVANYKNVIFWAEYEDRDRRNPRHVRDFNKPLGKN